MLDNANIKDSLITKEGNQSIVTSQNGKINTKITKKKIIIISASIVIELALIVAVVLITLAKPDKVLQPVKIRIALPADRPTQIELGRSRVLEVLFYSGRDNRTTDDFMNVVNRDISWSTNPEGIITVDPYGRVQTLALGKTAVKVQSLSNPKAQYQSTIEVISPYKAMGKDVPKRIVNFKGVPASPNKVLQKYITKYTKDEVQMADQIPVSIKDVSKDPIRAKKTTIVWQNNMMISWNITQYADGSEGKFYIKRVDNAAKNQRDYSMSMISDRYLPGDGSNVISIEDDGQLGLWLVNVEGEVSHIEMKEVSYTSKAKAMVQQTQDKVLRHGLASGSSWDGTKWFAGISDNDGLWTSMYAAGEFMRYASLKQGQFPDQQIAVAKASAIQSLKAVLLISNISGRDKVVDARIRHFVNTRAGQIAFLSSEFLKKGKTYSIDNYVGSSIDGDGLFGIDAGKIIDNTYYGGTRKYSFESFEPNDWSKDAARDEPATTKRTLNGFIARSFAIPALDGPPTGGLFYQHNRNGTQTVISQASILYDYNDTDHPVLDLGNLPLPQVLQDFLRIDGVQYNKSDLVYKGDTSSDSTIGQLFMYKIAYDILDESLPDQKILKQLIRSTMQNFCHCLSNNGYNMVDATGQGTKWGKLVRDYMIVDGTIQDAPLLSAILLLSYKLCHYVTGNPIWQDQYDFLVEDPSFRYLDLNSAVWRRWTWRAYNQDYSPQFKLLHLNSSQNYSQQQVTRHIMYNIHYSDEEQAMLGYYLAFQLEENEQYLAKYREGLEGWWHSISHSENPLWYYIYQLAYPDKKIKDNFGNDILDVSSWQLSRHPVSARRSKAFIEGSRNDIIFQGDGKPSISVDPSKPISKRKHTSDAISANRTINKAVFENFDPLVFYEIKILPADERAVHKFNSATFQTVADGNYNDMQPSTSFTLPYWMGVYHKMLQMD